MISVWKSLMLLGVLTASVECLAQDETPPEKAAAAAVEAAMEEIDKEADEQLKFDERLSVCRAALNTDNWVAHVEKAVSNKPALGPLTDHLRICMAYLMGRRDQLLAERDRMKSR